MRCWVRWAESAANAARITMLAILTPIVITLPRAISSGRVSPAIMRALPTTNKTAIAPPITTSASKPPDAAGVRVNAVRAAGVMAQMLSLFDRADQHYQDSLKLAYRADEPVLIAAANHNLGTLRKDQGRFEEALNYFDESSHYQPPDLLKFHWQSKADTLQRLGRLDEAKVLYEKAMALNQRIGDEEGYAHTLRGLAEIACHKGDADTAEQLLRENEVICRRLNHARGLSWTSQLFGSVAKLRDDWPAARDHYNDALVQMETMGDAWGQCNVLTALGHLSIAEGDYTLALLNLQKAQEGWHKLGATLTPYEQAEIEAGIEQCRRHLTDPASVIDVL